MSDQEFVDQYIAVRALRCATEGCGHHIDAHNPDGCQHLTATSLDTDGTRFTIPDCVVCSCAAFVTDVPGSPAVGEQAPAPGVQQ